jgi:hypothetical protein
VEKIFGDQLVVIRSCCFSWLLWIFGETVVVFTALVVMNEFILFDTFVADSNDSLEFSFAVSLQLKFRTLLPPSSEKTPIRISTLLSTKTAIEGENVQIRIKVENVQDRDQV